MKYTSEASKYFPATCFHSQCLSEGFEVGTSKNNEVLTSRVDILIENVNAHIDLATLFPDISEKGLLDFT